MAIVCTNLYSESRKKTYFSRTTRVKNQKRTQVYYLNTDIKKSWRYRSVLSINISPLNWYASNVLHKRKRIPSNCRNLLTKRIPTLCCHFKKSNHDFTVHGRRERGGSHGAAVVGVIALPRTNMAEIGSKSVPLKDLLFLFVPRFLDLPLALQ